MKSKVLFPVIGLLLCCLPDAIAQDTAIQYKFGRHLTITFPAVPDSGISGSHTFTFVNNNEGISYLVVTSKDTFKIKNKRHFETTLEGLAKGFMEKGVMGYTSRIIDTVISGSRGKYLYLFNPPSGEAITEIASFLTVLDNRFYGVKVEITDGDRDRAVAFFNSMEFRNGKNYPDSSLTAYDIGYKLGYYFVPVALITLLIVFIVRRINSNNRKERNRRLTGSI